MTQMGLSSFGSFFFLSISALTVVGGSSRFWNLPTFDPSTKPGNESSQYGHLEQSFLAVFCCTCREEGRAVKPRVCVCVVRLILLATTKQNETKEKKERRRSCREYDVWT